MAYESNTDIKDSNTNALSETLDQLKKQVSETAVGQDVGHDEAIKAIVAATTQSMSALQVNAVSMAQSHQAAMNVLSQRQLNNSATHDKDIDAQKIRHTDHTLIDLHGE